MTKVKHEPISLQDQGKRDLRTQFGAICYRVKDGTTQVLLVTSRSRKRWIVPKGWPIDGATPAQAAKKEAFEEAGARGKCVGVCLGLYSYTKEVEDDDLPCVVALYPLKVSSLIKDYPEAKERKRKWFSTEQAASLVDSPELAQIIKGFDPANLAKG